MKGKQLGTFMLVVGILDAVLMHFIKKANQPIRVTSSLGSGYMTDGWGDALPMFNTFMVIGIIIAVIGLIMLIADERN